MSIIKRTKANYGAVPRDAMNGKHMSLKAKGLLAYLLCMPDNWQIYVSELANHHKEHKDTIAKAINELIDSGYVVREQVRENGRFRGYDYSVYDYQVTAKTVNEKTVSEKTVYGKSNTNKLDSTKLDNTKKESKSASLDLPFSSKEFQEAWEIWGQHRKEKRQKLTATTIKLQFKQLTEMGEARAIKALIHSAGQGYTGIFEEKGDKAVNGAVTSSLKARVVNSADEMRKRFG